MRSGQNQISVLRNGLFATITSTSWLLFKHLRVRVGKVHHFSVYNCEAPANKKPWQHPNFLFVWQEDNRQLCFSSRNQRGGFGRRPITIVVQRTRRCTGRTWEIHYWFVSRRFTIWIFWTWMCLIFSIWIDLNFSIWIGLYFTIERDFCFGMEWVEF